MEEDLQRKADLKQSIEQQSKQGELEKAVETKIAEEKPKVVTRTEEEYSKMQSTLEKKWRDADSRATKVESLLQKTQTDLATLEDRLTDAETERDRRLFEGLDAEPQTDRLKALHRELTEAKTNLRKQQREFAGTQVQAMEGLKFLDAHKTAREAQEKYGISIEVDELMVCDSYADMVIKARDLVIEQLKTVKGTEESESHLPKHIDSGLQTAAGEGRIWKGSEIQKMNIKERESYRSEIAKATKEGRIRYDE